MYSNLQEELYVCFKDLTKQEGGSNCHVLLCYQTSSSFGRHTPYPPHQTRCSGLSCFYSCVSLLLCQFIVVFCSSSSLRLFHVSLPLCCRPFFCFWTKSFPVDLQVFWSLDYPSGFNAGFSSHYPLAQSRSSSYPRYIVLI